MINKKGKIKLLVLISITLLVAMLLFLSAVSGSNTKEYDEINKIVTIKDSSGEIISDITLNTPLNFIVPRGYQKVAEFTIENKGDSKTINSMLEKLDFYDLNKDMQKIEREFDYKYEKSLGLKTINDYETICIDEEDTNGTISTACDRILKGTHQEEIFEWVDLSSLEEIPSGKIKIGIFTNVEKGDNIEWIPTFLGVEVNEWASWTEGLDVGLVAYYKMDETSGTTIIDYVGYDDNGTVIGGTINQSGKINTGYSYSSNDYDWLWDFSENDDWTISIWAYMTNFNNLNYMWSLDKDDGFGEGAYAKTAEGKGFCLYDGSVSGCINNAPIYVDRWCFYGITKDNLNYTFYVTCDNETNFAINSSTLSDLDIDEIVLGYRGDGSWGWVGRLDEVGFWNRTLNLSEMTELYNNGSGLSYEVSSQNYTITFNLTDSITGQQIDTSHPGDDYSLSCDNGFNDSEIDDNPHVENNFGSGTINCNFTSLSIGGLGYFDKEQEIILDGNKTVDIEMSPKNGLTQEEHDWLEAVYECLIEGTGCA